MPTYLTNADLFKNLPPPYYLDRSHHTGQQPISSIIGLQALLDASSGSGASLAYVNKNIAEVSTRLNTQITEVSTRLSFAGGAGVEEVSTRLNTLLIKTNAIDSSLGRTWISVEEVSTRLSLVSGVGITEVSTRLNVQITEVSTRISALDVSLANYVLKIYLDASLSLYYTKAYVDSSLALKLNEASIGVGFNWNAGKLDVSAIGDVTKLYVDSCLGQFIRSASLGYGLFWNPSGVFDVSIVAGSGKDPSIDDLYVWVVNTSVNTGGTNYTSNLFINDGDQHVASLSNLDQIMGLIAPAKPDLLTGKDPSLQVSTLTLYSAKIPTGLPATWYTSLGAGSTIPNYIVDTTYRIYTPSYASSVTACFRAGLWQDSLGAGTLTAVINGADSCTYNMTLGVGNVSIYSNDVSMYMRCNSLGGYGGSGSNFWRKAEAFMDITSQKEGLIRYALKHSEAGQTNDASFYYDPSNATPTFTQNASAYIVTDVSVFLSGIIHYGNGCTFTTSYIAAPGIFTKAYHPTAVGTLTSAAGSSVTTNPTGTPWVDGSFGVITTFTFNTGSYSSGLALGAINARIQKPTTTSADSSVRLSRRVNTYTQTRATTTIEYFTDESLRLKNPSSGTDLAWDPSNYYQFNPADGSYAQVRNGTLTYPISADYASFAFTGIKHYMRRFTKAAASSGTFTFTAFNPIQDSSVYGVNPVNILIWLTDQGLFFDTCAPYGIGGGDGKTMATAISAGNGNKTATTIPWTLGTYSTGNETTHTGTYAIIIAFRNSTKSMTQIIAS